MPEGDTIFRTARTLHAALAGKTVTRLAAPRVTRPLPGAGAVVTRVEARGKHCLVHFDDGRALRTHMMMTGSWHLYRPGERWRKSRGAARVVLEAGEGDDAWVAVCFAAPVVELLEPAAARRGDGTSHLGPDLCLPDADIDEAARRMATLTGDDEIGDALLDQRVACGVGNVYRCEALFACGVHPAAAVADLDDGVRRTLLETASRQLRANLDRSGRATVAGGRLAVYGRGGSPCRRCGTPVAVARRGRQARVVYWCPRCQPLERERAVCGGTAAGGRARPWCR